MRWDYSMIRHFVLLFVSEYANMEIMIARKKKQAIITKSAKHKTDTGSSQVQVALLDERIKELTQHLKKNRKDEHSRRGLLKLVSKRRAHQKYLKFK